MTILLQKYLGLGVIGTPPKLTEFASDFVEAKLGAPKGGGFDQGLFSKMSSRGFRSSHGFLEKLEFVVF